ncbi:uncharacterized protein TRIADDRAFT_27870 [Trichoplax adhaerens]|uniref:Insulin receptor substrate 1 n=1 Tax=Trichoplax adhaerens TaxID=10228 RepID=B3S160_TRIAD|nr:hypothetical protein TRIADDRAFT_27870 [Trichoplax adhaerens]EDV23509.1 hypothetical protein TRIADDRAFT_27870 [Trichoplax adhaerens]|eukprot:XP_002114419.1 hypothetical protein TRIADDRAFT_27870 [Trichoplax adhaerens]
MAESTDIRKRGYLKKVKNSRERYYVLRYESNSGPSRIECYHNEKKFNRNALPRRVIRLADCWKIIKMANSKYPYTMSFYTQEYCYSLYTKAREELESWLIAIDEVKHSDSQNSRDNQDCWQVTVIDRDVAKSKQLAGAYSLQMLPSEMKLTRLGSSDTTDPLVLKYLYIRRCGHAGQFFFVENGHSACTGPGKLWMQVDDQIIAERIHAKAIR